MPEKIICAYIVFLIVITFIFAKFMIEPLAKASSIDLPERFINETRKNATNYDKVIKDSRNKNKYKSDKNSRYITKRLTKYNDSENDEDIGEENLHPDQFDEVEDFDADKELFDMHLKATEIKSKGNINRKLQHNVLMEDFESSDGDLRSMYD